MNILPTVRKIMASTISLDIVSVKPMSAPKSSINYIDFVYGTSDIKLDRKKKIDKIYNKENR